MAEEKKPWRLSMTYDRRFGLIDLIASQEDGERVPFRVPLGEMLKHLSLQPYELRALLDQRYAWTEGLEDIEKARVRLLESVDWRGKTVLDVGGYDGFAAEIAHKGGAARAICLDNHQYEHYGWDDRKKEGVRYLQGDFTEWLTSIYSNEIFVQDGFPHEGDSLPRPDVVIFFNVLYHLKNPWAALDKLRELVKPDGEMLLCTLFRYHEGSWIYLYEPRECNPGDDTVYFGPSLDAIERLLKATGWDAERYALSHDRVLYRCKPTAGWARKHEDS